MLEMRREIASLEDIFQMLAKENETKEQTPGKTALQSD